MRSDIGNWLLEILSLGARRRVLRESADRLADYYCDFAVRNKDAPVELEDEFRDLMNAAEILLKQKKWDRLIGIADAISAFMEERGYWSEALWLYSAALDGVEWKLAGLFRQPVASDWTHRISFLTRLGGISVRQGYLQDAEQYLVEALRTAERIKNKKFQAQLNNFLGTLSRLQGQFEMAQKYLEQSSAILPELEEQGQLLGRYLQSLSIGNLNEAKQLALARRDVARQSGDKSLEAGALCNLGDIAIREGNEQEAIAVYQQAIALYLETQDQDDEMDAWRNLAKAHGAFGNLEEAHRILDQVQDFYTRKVSPAAVLDVLIDKGGYLVDEKKYEEAEACFQEGLNIAIELQSLPQQAICFYNIGIVWERRGNLEQAIQQYKQFLKAADESQHQQLIGIAYYCLAMAFIQNGNFVDARPCLTKRLEIYRGLHMRTEEASTLHLLGEVDTKLEFFESAESLLEQAAALHFENGHPADGGQVLYSLSRLFFEQHQFARSWEYLLQIPSLLDAASRKTLLPLVLTMLDRFSNMPAYQGQSAGLRESLVVVESDATG